jgi:hypothetical protein
MSILEQVLVVFKLRRFYVQPDPVCWVVDMGPDKLTLPSIGSSSEELMSTQPGIKILILPINNHDVLSKLFVMGHMIELIVFMPESAIVSWASRKATWPIIK